MKLYSKEKNYTLYHGNMLDMLEVIQPRSIDSIVTDPPYELGFMGKSWDKSGIAFNEDTWKKCYEVLKPGGYLLAFGGSRTFHRIACAIEDAGFEIRDTIMWLYGSGFPKSMDISKQIDKKGGGNYSEQFALDLKQARESRNLTMKYCDDKYCNGSTNWSWYEGRKDGCRVPDYETYLEIIKEFPELEKYKELIKEAEREVIGTTITNKTIYQRIGDKNISGEIDITIPSTDLAKQWQGWGTQLKPSYEPIIVARKPVENTIVDNVLKYGVGGINIDECRVNFVNEEDYNVTANKNQHEKFGTAPMTNNNVYGDYSMIQPKNYSASGRFPANTILTYDDTDFNEVCGGFPNTKSVYEEPNKKHTFKGNKDAFQYGYKDRIGSGYEDSGSASRYFYCAKASKKDRDDGLDEFEEKQMYDGKNAQFGYGNTKDDNFGDRVANVKRKNTHPTVKPMELMQYLIRLVTPNNGTILDPFNGSGSTGKAAMYENKERNKNYKYIGIELTADYLPISKARIEYAINSKADEDKKKPNKKKAKDKNTTKLF